jgi:membrane protease YdiL (CAAX protease family)
VGECDKMKKEIYLPAFGIAAGELMMFYGNIFIGLAIHIINLQAIALALIFSKFPSEIKNIHQSLILLLQMRIIALAMPQFFTLTLLWYPFIYGVMYIPVYLIIKNQNISSKEIGMNFSRIKIYLPSAVLIGSGMAVIEYYILQPVALIENANISNLVLISVVMFIFIGAVEELIFRSILQTRVEKVLGLNYGILISGGLFGIMHASYGLINEIIFAGFFGCVLGYIFQKTRSFPCILAIHGTANVLLFGILPILLA